MSKNYGNYQNDQMSRILFFLSVFFGLVLSAPVHSQEISEKNLVEREGKTFLQHQVSQGETLYGISAKYKVEVINILNSNPQLISGLKAGDSLLIPWSEAVSANIGITETKVPQSFLEHEVKRRETLYSISRQYGVTIDEILHFNKGVGQLKRKDILRIPQWKEKASLKQEVRNETVNAAISSTDTYVVLPGETWYSISRRFGTTVEVLNQLNPEISGLKPGQSLKVPAGATNPKSDYKDESDSQYESHTIVSGETLYSLTRKYNVSAETLIELNPNLSGSFRTGNVIRIPRQSAAQASTEKYLVHIVKPGETQFSLLRAYNVNIDQLKQWNNYLNYRGLLVGDTLRLIPGDLVAISDENHDFSQRLMPGDCEKISRGRIFAEPLDIVMFLPLMIDINSRLNPGSLSGPVTTTPSNSELAKDSIQVVQAISQNPARFQGTSENFIHFYEGSIMAIQKLQSIGVKVRLTVVDTEKRSQQISSLVSSGRFNDADLIIGPIYPEDQKIVAEFSKRMQIPMVSPLSSSDEHLKNNPWTFQVNPSRSLVDRITAEYIYKEYGRDNIVLVKGGNQSDSVEAELRRLASVRDNGHDVSRLSIKTVDKNKSGIAGLTGALRTEGKNVVVLTSGNEAEVSVAVSNIHTLAGKYDIVLVGSNRFTQFESINQEYFHDGQLEFLAPYWPDYTNSLTKEFVKEFREYFKTEPNQYSMQGYDVTYFFAKAIAYYGDDFRKCLNLNRGDLVQGNYFFVPQAGGGFVNEGLNVVSYTKDYRVVKKKDLKK